MPNNLPLSLSFTCDPIPEGIALDPNEYAQAITERLHAFGNGNFLGGVVGGTMPTSDQGLWLNQTGIPSGYSQLSTWNQTYGKYTPLYGGGPVSQIVFTAANYDMGSVGEVVQDFVVCNGHEYQVADFPILYDAIGILYGGTQNVSFKVPDYRGRIPIGQGTGVDYLSANKSLTTRLIGAIAGYLGHEFIHQDLRPANAPVTPANQIVSLLAATSQMTSGLPPATVCSVLIRVR